MGQEELSHWYNEMVEYRQVGGKVARIYDGYIYKGFKIDLIENHYHIFDVRWEDTYSRVKYKDLLRMQERGFVTACDEIMTRRDHERMKRLLRQLGRIETRINRIKNSDNPVDINECEILSRHYKKHWEDYYFYAYRWQQYND